MLRKWRAGATMAAILGLTPFRVCEKQKEAFMRNTMAFLTVLAGVLGLAAVPAQAQIARTFVSSFGNDANNCDRPTPCRTFQHAHDQTLANGEITVLDPGGYGAVVINKTISIINDGVGEAGMLISGGVTGVTFVGAAGDTVSLRGLTIKGIGFGSGNGINFISGKFMSIENCAIRNLPTGNSNTGIAIWFNPGGQSVSNQLAISNTLIADSTIGIDVGPTGTGVVKVSLFHVELYDNLLGLNVAPGSTTVSARVSALSSAVDGNAAGVEVSTLAGSSALTSVTFALSLLTNNDTALVSTGSGASQLRIGQSLLAGNGTAWTVSTGGVFQSFGDNYIVGNDNQPTPPTVARE